MITYERGEEQRGSGRGRSWRGRGSQRRKLWDGNAGARAGMWRWKWNLDHAGCQEGNGEKANTVVIPAF